MEIDLVQAYGWLQLAADRSDGDEDDLDSQGEAAELWESLSPEEERFAKACYEDLLKSVPKIIGHA